MINVSWLLAKCGSQTTPLMELFCYEYVYFFIHAGETNSLIFVCCLEQPVLNTS